MLIALCDCVAMLSGEVKTRAAIASQRAASYLEQTLSSLSDPYHLSLTVYALGVSMGQGDIEHGYLALMQKQRQNSGASFNTIYLQRRSVCGMFSKI